MIDILHDNSRTLLPVTCSVEPRRGHSQPLLWLHIHIDRCLALCCNSFFCLFVRGAAGLSAAQRSLVLIAMNFAAVSANHQLIDYVVILAIAIIALILQFTPPHKQSFNPDNIDLQHPVMVCCIRSPSLHTGTRCLPRVIWYCAEPNRASVAVGVDGGYLLFLSSANGAMKC